MRIGIVVVEIIGHRLYHRPWNLCAARPVEIGNRVTVMSAVEGRKTFPDFCGRRGRGFCLRLQLVNPTTAAGHFPGRWLSATRLLIPASAFRAAVSLATILS